MGKIIHMSLSIIGFIKYNKYPDDYRDFMLRDDGTDMTASEARDYLFECLLEGKKFLPVGECEGFDYKEHRCPGHENKEDKENVR